MKLATHPSLYPIGKCHLSFNQSTSCEKHRHAHALPSVYRLTSTSKRRMDRLTTFRKIYIEILHTAKLTPAQATFSRNLTNGPVRNEAQIKAHLRAAHSPAATLPKKKFISTSRPPPHSRALSGVRKGPTHNAFFLFFYFLKTFFYKNIVFVSQFRVLYPCRPLAGR